jgi:hypothetical protein
MAHVDEEQGGLQPANSVEFRTFSSTYSFKAAG